MKNKNNNTGCSLTSPSLKASEFFAQLDKNLNKDNQFGIFDKIYCINLDRRKDRWAESEIEFNKHGLKVERFTAVDGDSIILRDSNRVNKGNQGCVLSHIAILKSMVENGLQRVLILEDDVAFIGNLNELFGSYIKQVPIDWDMLYLGGNHIEKPIKISDNIGKLKKTLTTSHYAITNKMAVHLISKIDEYDLPIDTFYSAFHSVFNCYVFMPHLAWQRASFSDIENGYRDYTSILK